MVLGFSMGGFIAWKASLLGLKTTHLFAISATRIRYETQKPDCTISLFYGSDDVTTPNKTWLKQMELDATFYPNEGHEMYQKEAIAKAIRKVIIQQLK